jgi:type IV pilus assembly protein PilC
VPPHRGLQPALRPRVGRATCATATFEYKVRDSAGKLKSGKIDAETPAQVAAKLKSMGLAPLSITEANTGMNKEISIPGLGKKKVKLKDLAVFSRQFATMINSGLSLLRSLSILTEQTENKELARILGEVRNDIETGSSLSVSMAKHPDVFPPLMVNMCRAGEVGGFLDMVLLQIAENYEAEVKLKGKVKAAMTYPVVVFIIAVVAVIGMLLFIVPVFVGLFADFDSAAAGPDALPGLPVRLMKFFAPLGVVGLIVFSIVWPKVKRKDGVRNVLDPLKLKLPVFGLLFQKIALARFARNLGTMMKSGVPILQSLDIVSSTTATSCSSGRSRTCRTASARARRWPPRWRTTRSSRRWWCR